MEDISSRPSMQLSLPSQLGFEKIARDAVATFAQRLGFDPERLEDLKTALSEACVNAIEHGNQQISELCVTVHCRCDGYRLVIEVDDQGMKRPECDATTISASIDSKLCGDARLRGMGLMMIAQLVDEAGFVERPEGGNRFWFAFHYRRPSPYAMTDLRIQYPTIPSEMNGDLAT